MHHTHLFYSLAKGFAFTEGASPCLHDSLVISTFLKIFGGQYRCHLGVMHAMIVLAMLQLCMKMYYHHDHQIQLLCMAENDNFKWNS